MGTDRNIPDIVLETRSKILYSLLRLFHNSIEKLQESLGDEDENISDKLSELFQVYLPILQYATNTFGNIPVLKIPKVCILVTLFTHLTIFLQILHVLTFFLEYKHFILRSNAHAARISRNSWGAWWNSPLSE